MNCLLTTMIPFFRLYFLGGGIGGVGPLDSHEQSQDIVNLMITRMDPQ